jgi:hypothetical protein
MAKKIEIYQLEDGEPSPKIIHIPGKSLSVIYCPSASLRFWMNKLNEFNGGGVYILKYDPTDDANYSEKVYVGESEQLKGRLSNHYSDEYKDFKECITIISTRENELTKAHIKNMESKLYKIVSDYRNAELFQKVPTESKLSPSDQIIVDEFIELLKIILPLCGFNCLIPTTIDSNNINNLLKYTIKRKDIEATMVIENNNYIILKGSTARITENEFRSKKLINKLLNNNSIKISDDKKTYLFLENTIFASSSSAASIALGANVSGNESWLNDKNVKLGNL